MRPNSFNINSAEYHDTLTFENDPLPYANPSDSSAMLSPCGSQRILTRPRRSHWNSECGKGYPSPYPIQPQSQCG